MLLVGPELTIRPAQSIPRAQVEPAPGTSSDLNQDVRGHVCSPFDGPVPAQRLRTGVGVGVGRGVGAGRAEGGARDDDRRVRGHAAATSRAVALAEARPRNQI
mgnify:CR=1 FL=1